MVIKTAKRINGLVNIKVDEGFFDQFENKRKDIADKLGLRTISQKDFTEILAKKKIFENVKLLKNEDAIKRKKR